MALRLTEEEYQALMRRRVCGTVAATSTAQGANDGKRSAPVALPRAPGRSPAAEALAAQLLDAVIPFEREHRFAPPRKFRFDFVLLPICLRLAVEADGGVHRIDSRWRSDREKGNLALQHGWRVYHFALAQIRSGEALSCIRGALCNSPR